MPIFWLPLVSAKKMPRLMRPAASAVSASRPLARAMPVARSTTSLNGVAEFCAFAGGACMMREEADVLIDQRLDVGIEVGRWNSELVGPADAGRKRVGEILVRAHHGEACKVERLPGQVRQRLSRIDLRAALAEDRLELADGLVVGSERIRLRLREGCRLSACGRDEVKNGSASGWPRQRGLRHASLQAFSNVRGASGGLLE